MSHDLRINWEPENLTPLSKILGQMEAYAKGRGGVTILKNGTLLFIKQAVDDAASARKALHEAKFLTDFRILRLKEGDYLVALHSAVAVYVSADEFEAMRSQIENRIADLKFPSEELIAPTDSPRDNMLLGLYGRGKLQRDIYAFELCARIH